MTPSSFPGRHSVVTGDRIRGHASTSWSTPYASARERTPGTRATPQLRHSHLVQSARGKVAVTVRLAMASRVSLFSQSLLVPVGRVGVTEIWLATRSVERS